MSSNKRAPAEQSGEKYSSDFNNSRRGDSKRSTKKQSLPAKMKKPSSRGYSSNGAGKGGREPSNDSNERIIVEEM
jgi:hypothetical protein